MSSEEAREQDDDRIPMDLVSKPALVKPPDSSRPLNSQVSQITQLRVNRSNSGVQTSGALSITPVTQSGISPYSQTMLKQDALFLVNVTRGNIPSAVSVVGSPTTSRPPILTTLSHSSPSYHVPRGAAAVANISIPRSAVATPIVRPTTTLQTSVISTATHTSFSCGPRTPAPTLISQESTPVSSNTAWLTTSNLPVATSVPLVKSVSPGPLLRTQPVPTFTQSRVPLPASSKTSIPQGNRQQNDPPRPQLIRPSAPKPIAMPPTAPQIHIPEKYYKPVSSIQSAVAQVLPARTPATVSYSSPITSSSISNFPPGTATLITGQGHQLAVTPGQGSTAVLTSLATRLAMTNASSMNQRPTLISTTSSMLGTPTRITMSQGTALLATPARITVASAPINQVSCPTTPVRPTVSTTLSGSVLSNSNRLNVTSSQATLLTGQTRLAMPSSTPIRPNVSSHLTSPARIAVSATGQNPLLSTTTRLAMPPSCVAVAQGTAMLTQMRVAVPSGVSTPAGVVSLHPVVVPNTSANIPLKPAGQQLGTSVTRTITTHQNIGPKVITQAAHGTSIQLTQVPITSAKVTQALHTTIPRTIVYTTTTTISSNISGMRPITVAPATTQSIPVAKVFPTAVGISRASGIDLGTAAVSEVLPVHAIHTVTQAPSVAPQGTSVFIQASPRASPAPTTQTPIDRGGSSLSTYTLPATYFYETANGYQVGGGSLVARPYPQTNTYALQTTPTTQALRPGVATQTVHKSITSSESAVPQNNQALPANKTNASPRPSILRKRDSEGSPLKAQKNLGPVLASLSSDPISPPSPHRPDSRGNGGNSSGGSTTISATSSPGLNDAGEDSLPPTKTELEDGEKPPIEMSPRKKPRKQQLTGNELPEPKFSEDEMEFISNGKVKEALPQPPPPPPPPPPPLTSRHLPEKDDQKTYTPKRPHMSLIKSYRHAWKSRHNHFVRYSDVKPKEDRRPTLTDIANQKNILQKLNGWKVYHLGTQMLELAEMEEQVSEKLSSILKVMEQKTEKEFEKDVNRLHELIKGNMQRSKIIRDQMQDAEVQVKKIFEHKEHVSDIISRCATKRSVKKREKS